MADLKNKKIIITGAGSGMGKATALELAKNQAIIIAVGNKKNNITGVAKIIRSNGGTCYTYVVDLANYSEILALYKQVAKKFKSIDWLINSAGIIEKEGQVKDLTRLFQINTLAIIYLSNLLNPILNKGGGIINISSIAGIWPSSIVPAYSASKAAVNAHSKVTAKIFVASSRKLSCFIICPGRTNTPLRQKIAGDARLYQGPEVIAKSIRNMISDQRKFKNGDVIIVKNGRQRLYENLL